MAGGAAGWVLRRFPPERYGFYPQCPVYASLHVKCPGCGATRALAALLHGRVLEALHWNALFTVGLGLCALYGVGWRRWGAPGPVVVCGGMVAAVGFMVLRNLEGGF
ncbi:MAG: DUF2752 domain-containing protein [Acidobacteriota bacterium]|nr:DUF2752 domain-containing protein [Acidobacteriota bacterium]